MFQPHLTCSWDFLAGGHMPPPPQGKKVLVEPRENRVKTRTFSMNFLNTYGTTPVQNVQREPRHTNLCPWPNNSSYLRMLLDTSSQNPATSGSTHLFHSPDRPSSRPHRCVTARWKVYIFLSIQLLEETHWSPPPWPGKPESCFLAQFPTGAGSQ